MKNKKYQSGWWVTLEHIAGKKNMIYLSEEECSLELLKEAVKVLYDDSTKPPRTP